MDEQSSKLWRLNWTDTSKVLKAFTYSLCATAVGLISAYINNLEVPTAYVFLVPVVNALLVALKKWLTDEHGQVLGLSWEKKDFNDLGKK